MWQNSSAAVCCKALSNHNFPDFLRYQFCYNIPSKIKNVSWICVKKTDLGHIFCSQTTLVHRNTLDPRLCVLAFRQVCPTILIFVIWLLFFTCVYEEAQHISGQDSPIRSFSHIFALLAQVRRQKIYQNRRRNLQRKSQKQIIHFTYKRVRYKHTDSYHICGDFLNFV